MITVCSTRNPSLISDEANSREIHSLEAEDEACRRSKLLRIWENLGAPPPLHRRRYTKKIPGVIVDGKNKNRKTRDN